MYLEKKTPLGNYDEISVPSSVSHSKQPLIFEIKNCCVTNEDKIIKYKSLEDYNQFPLALQNIGELSGCFTQDNIMG